MSNDELKQQVFHAADQLLLSGQSPTAQLIERQVDAGAAQVEACLALWWQTLSERVGLDAAVTPIPEVPDSLAAAFSRVWQQAVQEASSAVTLVKRHAEYGAEAERRVSEDALKQSHDHYQELEARYREQVLKLEKAVSASKAAEAESAHLKNSLISEAARFAKEEAQRLHLEQELEHLHKTYEDAKRGFDMRIKDEQRQNLEALAKSEADVKHYRSLQEKLRDEFGKKESVLAREISDLQAMQAKKDSRIDTLQASIRSLEDELKAAQQEIASQQRELSKVNANLLSEVNRSKRLDDRVKELEADLKQQLQRGASASSEAARRENALRAQVQAREEELLRVNAKVVAQEKRLITQDEELKRATARL
jgi:chromosome segregation ATPase